MVSVSVSYRPQFIPFSSHTGGDEERGTLGTETSRRRGEWKGDRVTVMNKDSKPLAFTIHQR